MHGFMQPAMVEAPADPSTPARLRTFWRKRKWFVLTVLLPTALVALYLFLFAANQYKSEAHYIVRAQSGAAPSTGSITQLLTGGGAGAAAGGQSEAMSVSDYLTSHDVVDALRKNADLVARFRRPEADVLSRLTDENPTPEALLRYYRSQVDVHYDTDTGITTMSVRAFRPDDAYDLARALLTLGEQRVNEMNKRAYSDAVSLSQRQLTEAEQALDETQRRMTAFRQVGGDIDPAGTSQAQIGLVSQLNANLAAARAQMATTASLIGRNNPQYAALVQRVRSLEAQVASQSGVLAGGGTAIAANLGDYERLRMQQGFLTKRYEAASAAFEAARQKAVAQQLYVVRVVDANMPVKSQYPQRGLIVLTLFVGLLVVYGIGWLIAAGVREHAN